MLASEGKLYEYRGFALCNILNSYFIYGFVPNIFLSTSFLNALKFYASLRVTVQFQKYKEESGRNYLQFLALMTASVV
jgi:hypothetical protein